MFARNLFVAWCRECDRVLLSCALSVKRVVTCSLGVLNLILERVNCNAAKECNCTAANNGYNGFPERDKDDRERVEGRGRLRATGWGMLYCH